MEAESVLNLFDSYWFNLEIFKKKPIKNQNFPEIPTSNPEIPTTLPTIQTKFQKITPNFSPKKQSESSSSSPNSVLLNLTPKLQTIFSGKISAEFEDSSRSEKLNSPLKGNTVINRRRKNKGFSKSLSDLEFEELKGFIDLGFIFSEEDKDSNLVSIIPGLQRLSISNHNININNDINESIIDKSGGLFSRPYLSEAWDDLEKKRRENLLLNWRVPPPDNQIEMKDYLRFWAHTVASTVK